MKVALFGETGLIGSAIRISLARESEVISPKRSTYDFCQPATLKGLDLSGCDTIIHAAGVTDELVKASAERAYNHALWGSKALCELAQKFHIRKLIYISTAHVYGRTEGQIDENTAPTPLNDYALCHLIAEHVFRQYSELGITKVHVLRPTAVYGMPSNLQLFKRWALVPYSFPLSLVGYGKIVLHSAGLQQRSFVGLDTICSYVDKLLRQSQSSSQFQVINPLGEQILSVYEFGQLCLKIFEQITGTKASIERPTISGAAKTELIYQSTFPKPKSSCNLAEYLEQIMLKLIDDKKRGVSYGL